MSLLRCARLPRLPRAPRPLAVALSSLPGSDLEDPRFASMLDEEYDEDGTPPPTGPDSAYPAPHPAAPNPMRAADLNMPAWTRATPTLTNPIYSLHLRASKRNTIATFTKPQGDVIKTCTGGGVGFKHGNRSSYEAGHQCAVEIFKGVRKAIEDTGGRMAIHLYFSGFGNGREAMMRALTAQEGTDVRSLIFEITDKTPIKIGGTRAMKARRL